MRLRLFGHVFVARGLFFKKRKKGSSMGLKFRLGLMMFLQYAIWGAWYPALSAYLQNSLGMDKLIPEF
jgi:hypothetical protein